GPRASRALGAMGREPRGTTRRRNMRFIQGAGVWAFASLSIVAMGCKSTSQQQPATSFESSVGGRTEPGYAMPAPTTPAPPMTGVPEHEGMTAPQPSGGEMGQGMPGMPAGQGGQPVAMSEQELCGTLSHIALMRAEDAPNGVAIVLVSKGGDLANVKDQAHK